jgi:hypothetical protein
MSEFKRKRIYYTKAQIKTGLVTEGEEFMFMDGTEYIGQYHTYTTEETFSEPNFVKDKSRMLIPYVPPIGTSDTVKLGGIPFDVAKNYVYDQIKEIKFKKSLTPNDTIVTPTDKDFGRGYMIRYFAKKVNDDIIIELDRDKKSEWGKDGGLDKHLWELFEFRWKVSGPEFDIIDKKSGILTQSGIVDTNRRTIALIAEKYPHISNILVNLTEYSE